MIALAVGEYDNMYMNLFMPMCERAFTCVIAPYLRMRTREVIDI